MTLWCTIGILIVNEIVNVATHNDNILDQFITNRSDLFVVQVAQSLVKTKHKALIEINLKAECAHAMPRPSRTIVQLWNYTPMAASLLRQALSHYNWNGVNTAIECRSDSIDAVYNDYTDNVKWHLNTTVPICNVSMRERDPSYVTPRIKILLRKRNKLRRAGKIEHADCTSVKINRLITKTGAQH